jgi:hypothetical protein
MYLARTFCGPEPAPLELSRGLPFRLAVLLAAHVGNLLRRWPSSGMVVRTHRVGRRTIVKALACADPPERKKIRREPTALTGLRTFFDAMIAAHPQITIAAIWEHLPGEHDATIAYPTLRTYVISHLDCGA